MCKYANDCEKASGWCKSENVQNECPGFPQFELTTLRKELTTLAIESVNREKTLAKLEAEVKLSARVTEERDAYKEMVDSMGQTNSALAKKLVDVGAERGAAVEQLCNSCKAIAIMNGVKHTCPADCMWRGTDKEVR